jgi:plastocyanin
MTTRISRLAAARLILGFFAVTVPAVLVSPGPVRAATTSVAVENFDFSPASRTIDVGDVVRWTFSGNSHSVTSRDGLFDSGIREAGGSFEFTFTKAGTYTYYCVVHPTLMSGTIVVNGASATPNPTTRPTATSKPTPEPTPKPTATARPTVKPTVKPTPKPTASPTATPTTTPTEAVVGPSASPSPSASVAPTVSPASSQAVVEPPSPSSTPIAPAPSPTEPSNASDVTPIVAGGALVAAILLGGLLLARWRRAS